VSPDRPRRFLVSCGVFAPHAGGAESLFGDLSRELVRRGHAVTVVTRRLPETARRETVDGVRIERFRFPLDYEAIRSRARFLLGTPATLWRLARLLTRPPVDTVVIGLLDMSVVYLLWLRGRVPFRLVLYLHGGETRDLPERYPGFRRLLERCLAESDRVVAVSQGLADDAIRRLPAVADRVGVIPNGVDVSAIEAAPAETRARPYMLVVGRLVAGKRVDMVLTAFAGVYRSLDGVDLVIAGDGPEAERLQRLRAELGIPPDRVHMLGAVPRERVFGLMKGALFLVHASASEGDPIVVHEAKIVGRLVLAARSIGLDQAITEDVHGAFFDDPDDLGRLMARFTGSRAERDRIEGHLAVERAGSGDMRVLAERHLQALAP
jgi:glycosyltransferase involved in cell wall biosynthesis